MTGRDGTVQISWFQTKASASNQGPTAGLNGEDDIPRAGMRKYSFGNLITLIRNPSAILGEVRAVALKFNILYHKRFRKNDGVLVTDEDWDNLIVLDGCRYDLFKSVNELKGNLQSITSRGSTSTEFLAENFTGKKFHDIVYVSANPYMHTLDSEDFHRIYDLSKTDWDEKEETVLPGRVVERAIEAHEAHPNKRLVIHFMQPHYPFIGELGKQISHRGYKNRESRRGDFRAKYTVWGKLQYNLDGLTEEFVWDAYQENLEIVLHHVEDLIERLDGKSVITSDHGNLVGERLAPIPVKGYAHPGGLRTEELTKVPWFEPNFRNRREVVPEPPESDAPQTEIDKRKLEALGYLS